MAKKNLFLLIGTVLLALAGLILLLYPTLSDFLSRREQSARIQELTETVEELPDTEQDELRRAAEEYNRALYALRCGDAGVTWEALEAQYPDLLNLSGDGVMGRLLIPSIDVDLPILHGTDEQTLRRGVGHVETSSLPVGGENTHCVLSGHTGLPSAKLLTDLELVREGDEFSLEVLGERLNYRVDQILVVLPSETETLDIRPGSDDCTLVTCTPYGVNSHRLLVRGVRVTE